MFSHRLFEAACIIDCFYSKKEPTINLGLIMRQEPFKCDVSDVCFVIAPVLPWVLATSPLFS